MTKSFFTVWILKKYRVNLFGSDILIRIRLLFKSRFWISVYAWKPDPVGYPTGEPDLWQWGALARDDLKSRGARHARYQGVYSFLYEFILVFCMRCFQFLWETQKKVSENIRRDARIVMQKLSFAQSQEILHNIGSQTVHCRWFPDRECWPPEFSKRFG